MEQKDDLIKNEEDKKEIIKTIKRHLKGLQKSVEKLEKNKYNTHN